LKVVRSYTVKEISTKPSLGFFVEPKSVAYSLQQEQEKEDDDDDGEYSDMGSSASWSNFQMLIEFYNFVCFRLILISNV